MKLQTSLKNTCYKFQKKWMLQTRHHSSFKVKLKGRARAPTQPNKKQRVSRRSRGRTCLASFDRSVTTLDWRTTPPQVWTSTSHLCWCHTTQASNYRSRHCSCCSRNKRSKYSNLRFSNLCFPNLKPLVTLMTRCLSCVEQTATCFDLMHLKNTIRITSQRRIL